ncbi:MAG: cyclophilin family peptidyl-prolyl cis-trans isomerase [Saprospiraceae bacterium]|jgi:cyclophilin family peptidyl-prolyl cis-trans isomerase
MKQVLFFTGICLLSIITSCGGGDGFTYAEIETDFGTMKVKLYNSTPQHRDNFIKLAKEGYYDGLLFHRVIQGFMVQGGDPNSKDAGPDVSLGSGGPGYQIPAEIGGLHIKGALSAARTGNPEKKSSGSQFYIVQGTKISEAQLNGFEGSKKVKYSAEQRALYSTLGGTPALDNDYTVFGEVVEGMEVIDKIAAVPTKPGDRPVEDVKMKVSLVK